ncbi:MAG TPA: LysR family transcriptional regulator [Myxococcaceae bacterium]|nr:LysR family transcriptional regulator [Myxococcaceae bacterium]
MKPTLSQLGYFVAVADAGSFTTAARQLGVSQPTISAAVAELEALVGTAIFLRSRAGVELTPTGRDLLGRARGVLAALEELREGIARLRDPEVKLLRFAYSPILDIRSLNRLAAPFIAEHPAVQLVFKECQVGDVAARVEAQQADIVFAPRGIGSPDWVRCTLYRERLRYVPPGGSRPGLPARVSLREISGDRLLLPQGVCGLADATRQMFAEHRLRIDEYPGRAISYGALEDWAELGLGGALLPESKVRSADPLPVLTLGDAPALLTYDAMWPPDTVAAHVRGFTRKLPGLARALFASTQGVWAPAARVEPARARSAR